MQNDVLVSIIVPIYNVEAYLKECVDSIIHQSYRKLEIILVDDGSPDSCGEMCDNYALQDKRVKVIHKENGGLSDARNVGFLHSTGEYVLFIDSDDYINFMMVEVLLNAIKQNDADVATCPFEKFEKYENIYDNNAEVICTKVVKGRQLVEDLFKGKCLDISFTVWNKLFRRGLFSDNDIIFPAGRIYEDTYVVHKLLYLAKEIVIVSPAMYYYRIREGSIMNTPISLKKCIDGIEGDLSAVVYFQEKKDETMVQLALALFYKDIIKEYSRYIQQKNKECVSYAYKKYVDIWKKYYYSGAKIERIFFSLFVFFPRAIAGVFTIRNSLKNMKVKKYDKGNEL